MRTVSTHHIGKPTPHEIEREREALQAHVAVGRQVESSVQVGPVTFVVWKEQDAPAPAKPAATEEVRGKKP